MFYDEMKTINACDDEPSLIFELLKEEHVDLIDKILFRKSFDINVVDEHGNSILTKLLKKGYYDIVLKHMKDKRWNINQQNEDGDTFAHILVSLNYLNVVDIIKALKKNKNFMPNIRNNNGETILDKSIKNSYIYTTAKILEDERFNNIGIFSFKKLYDTYINNNNYLNKEVNIKLKRSNNSQDNVNYRLLFGIIFCILVIGGLCFFMYRRNKKINNI